MIIIMLITIMLIMTTMVMIMMMMMMMMAMALTDDVNDGNNDDDDDDAQLWHALAKTMAEKAAWALAMDRGISMVAINSGLLEGTGLSIANPYLKGAAEMYEEGLLVTVEDNFLADAHVCAFEDPSAYGRYLCFNKVVCRPQDTAELAKMMGVSCPPPSCRFISVSLSLD